MTAAYRVMDVRKLWSHLGVPNRSSVSCDLGIFVDQSADPVAASEAKIEW
jgi:hypothetical protein